MYKMAGVDIARYEQVSQPERERLAQKGIEEGCLYVNNLLARPLPSGTIYSNMSRIRIDPLDAAQWSRAEMEARRQVRRISRFFIENVPGLRRPTSSLQEISPACGTPEGSRGNMSSRVRTW